ncbi:MAG TPA: DUF2269 family protein [Acidimicrobiales bacterium]|nr:DUF2269 family protein [Acidimicrobiales bacterium]
MTRGTLLVLHVLSAAVGFGAIFITGVYAGLARRRADAAVRRYFRPGPNWAARALYVVPVLGVALVTTSHGSDRFGQVWVWVSLVLWFAATGLAHGVVWPAEGRIQRLLGEGGPGGRPGDEAGPGGGEAELDGACRRVVRAAALIDAVFVASVVLMVVRPGGGG